MEPNWGREEMAEAQCRIAELEAEVEEMRARKNAAYEERNRVVAALAQMALAKGWKVSRTRTTIEGWNKEWHGCVFIETPVGQMSWHYHDSHEHLFRGLPTTDIKWDGHTTSEKYNRLEYLGDHLALCIQVGAAGPGEIEIRVPFLGSAQFVAREPRSHIAAEIVATVREMNR